MTAPSYETNWIHGRFRCEDGNLMRHDPQHDDPYLETNVGTCPVCRGKGCPDPDQDDGREDDDEAERRSDAEDRWRCGEVF